MANGTTSVKHRVNASKLDKWDPIIEWYAKAVAEMQDKNKYPMSSARSWRYQAAIHGFDLRYPAWKTWTAGQQMPSTAEQHTYWGKCQHATWYFLPWHRMYLTIFEDMVRSVIVGLGGPANWALPYWNYSFDDNSRSLPPAFLDESTPFSAANPLYEPSRSYAGDGTLVLPPDAVRIMDTLADNLFENGNQPGFGGPDTNGPNHMASQNSVFGDLESQPHNVIHDDIGGIMGNPITAALDPIFWLHHANIDRLWVVWRQINPATNTNPTDPNWLSRWSFAFRDQNQQAVTRTPAQVLDTLSPILNYDYDDTSSPLAASGPVPLSSVPLSLTMPQQNIAEMVGATHNPIQLTSQLKTVDLPISGPTGPALMAARAGNVHKKVFLHVENITGSGSPTGYRVYLNLPAGAHPDQMEPFFVGIISMFGLEEASRSDQHQGGSGLHYAFDITKLADLPESKNLLESKKYTVTFEPRKQAPTNSQLSIGRISLYYQ